MYTYPIEWVEEAFAQLKNRELHHLFEQIEEFTKPQQRNISFSLSLLYSTPSTKYKIWGSNKVCKD